jgi:hypothetical protein
VSACARCGVEVRWVEVEGEGKVPLDARATYDGTYALDPKDVDKAYRIKRPGLYGHTNHDETCGQPIR